MKSLKKRFLNVWTFMVLAVILSIVGISLLITSEINVQEAITVELYPVNYKGYLYVELNKLQPFIDSEIFTKLLAEHKFSIIYENVYYEIQTTELVNSQFIRPVDIESILASDFHIEMRNKPLQLFAELLSIRILSIDDYERYNYIREIAKWCIFFGVMIIVLAVFQKFGLKELYEQEEGLEKEDK